MNVTWESHAVAINQIKDHINALTRQTAKLKDARSTGSPWQQTAIDRISPFLEELGGGIPTRSSSTSMVRKNIHRLSITTERLALSSRTA